MINLTYFKGDSMKPTKLGFKTKKLFISYIINDFECHKRVYVFGFQNDDDAKKEVFITESTIGISAYLCMLPFDDGDFFLHEYPSYEDAYAVALDFREANPLCYNN